MMRRLFAALVVSTLVVPATAVGAVTIIAMIDSKVVKVGKNKVKPGKRTVRVYSGGKLILSRTFTVK